MAAWTSLKTIASSTACETACTTDMNVYDAAALSAVVGLSIDSTAKRSRAVDFPDFTRGKWRTNPRLAITAD